MTRLLLYSWLFFLLSCTPSEPSLKDLHQLTEEEKASKAITLTPDIPAYTEAGKRITKKDWGTYLTDKSYTRDIYTDAEGTIKAVVFRKGAAPREVQLPEPMVINWVGQPAPHFTATDIDGNQVALARLKGKVVVLNFWFVACKPCVLEMPDLNALKEKYKGKEVVFLGLTFDTAAEVRTFLKGTPFAYTIISESKPVHADWGINAYPTNIVIDRGGTVRFMKYGLDRQIGEVLDEAIRKAL